jgi:hypothetical protein
MQLTQVVSAVHISFLQIYLRFLLHSQRIRVDMTHIDMISGDLMRLWQHSMDYHPMSLWLSLGHWAREILSQHLNKLR